MKIERSFPIQGEHASQPNCQRLPGCVPWAVAEIAYKTYAKFYGIDQSLDRLAERGGFSWSELVALLQGKRFAEVGNIPIL